MRQPSNTMVVLQLQEIFPHIPYTTLLQLCKDCGENSENVVTALSVADQGNTAAESTDFGGPLMSIDDCLNQQRLFSLFPQHGDVITDVFHSFSFNFVKTVDFLLSLTDDNSSGAVLSFALQPNDLPVVSLGNACDPLSASLSTSATTGSQRRLFRCPHCRHTCPSGEFRFCPHCGHPLEGRARL